MRPFLTAVKVPHLEAVWRFCRAEVKDISGQVQGFYSLLRGEFTLVLTRVTSGTLTRTPLALQIFHHLLVVVVVVGGGGGWTPPSISAPIGRKEKRKQAFESLSKMITKLLTSSNLHSGKFSSYVASRTQKCPIFFLPRLSNNVSERLHYLLNYYSYSKYENGIRKRIKISIAILPSDLTEGQRFGIQRSPK